MKLYQHLALVAAWGTLILQAGEKSLEQSFVTPPDSARPWVYWFWLSGNITSNGITADLEAMKRVGIAGALIMEVDQGAPTGPVDFMSDRWRGLFRHVDTEAKRLGLEINMNNDAGWNGSGGPWIKPEQAMQKVVWSETNIVGPVHFEGLLPQPETVAGYYRDITVLAFPAVGDYRIGNVRGKAAYEVGSPSHIDTAQIAADRVIQQAGVQTLSLNSQGRVGWDVPAGKWTILRFGHTCTGAENAPAPTSGRGLECDKLEKQGIEANFAGMMAKLSGDTGASSRVPRVGLTATHIDSWENGSQNWSHSMRAEFQKRRGYDPLPFLPVMTGRVIGSLEISERFLWDLRKTVSEMVIENYAGRMAQLAHAAGLRFTVEAYGSPCDSIPYAGQSDEPMGEFWTPSGTIETCKTMASAGHVYGKRIIGAEAFTSGDQERWREHPALLKALGDRAFCEGINRFVFHRYAMQPWTDGREPGMTMGPWGQHYERTQTWWNWTRPWHDYLARCQLLLREGLFVADLCYIAPESSPQGPNDHSREGYEWDECTAHEVLTRMSVRDGRIVLPDGMSYRLLVLPHMTTITPKLLRKVKELVQAGAVVLGPRPNASPSLEGYPSCDAEVQSLARELWADCDGTRIVEHVLGKGRILCGLTPAKALTRLGVRPDFSSGRRLRYLHRTSESADFYFVANSQPFPVATTCSFRVAGKVPEFWWPETGKRERAPVWREDGGLTQVSLQLPPTGSVFVVFREAAKGDPIVEVRCNGKPVIAAVPDSLPKPAIIRATYGVPGDSARTRDVKTKVQDKVNAGESALEVKSIAEGDDPALNVVKTLTVEYTIEGRSFTVSGRDGATVRLAPNVVGTVVQEARYGVLDDPARTRDVREKLQRLIDSGETAFPVARMADGDDPAFGVVKTLKTSVTIQGQTRQITGIDPDPIELLQAVAPPIPGARLAWDPAGHLFLQGAEPGRYQLVTASGRTRTLSAKTLPERVEVAGPWRVRFPVGSRVKESSLNQLGSWADSSETDIKYFSGAAMYTSEFQLPRKLVGKNKRIELDLGEVRVMAKVRLNGQDCGILWKPPFTVDVTGIARPGANSLEITVVNLWINRMIGDEQLPEDSSRNPDGTLKSWPEWLHEGKPSPTGRQTFTSWRLWKKDSPLQPSGLLGPVTIRAVAQQRLL